MPPHAIDWSAIQSRLAAATAAIAGGVAPGPDEVRRVLAERARAAARTPAVPDELERLEILAFSLAGEAYGVETCHVREVCQLKDLTVVPCTPRFVVGVVSLRGRILAIIDLRTLFDLPPRGLTEQNRIVVLRGDGGELGLLADSIDGVRDVPVSELQESLPTLTGVRDRFLRGVTRRMLTVLDGGRLLTDAGLKVHEQVSS